MRAAILASASVEICVTTSNRAAQRDAGRYGDIVSRRARPCRVNVERFARIAALVRTGGGDGKAGARSADRRGGGGEIERERPVTRRP